MGWPLRKGAKYNEFGGIFIYPMGEDKVCIGMVVGLDYTDATLSVPRPAAAVQDAPASSRRSSRAASASAGAPRRSRRGGYWSMPKRSRCRAW